MTQWIVYVGMILAGFLAGFINTLAGSGSLVTLPLLIFAGLPAGVANGTNRIGVLFQNLIAARIFYKEDKMDLKGAFYLGIPAIVGSIIGAQIAVNLNEEVMQRTIGVLMVVLLVVILIEPKRWLVGTLERIKGFPNWWQCLLFLVIGLYGGFIQAGVGIMLLSGLVLGIGYDLVRANAVKVGIVLLFTISSLVIFLINGQIHFLYGIIIASGQIVGGWGAAKVAVDKGAVWVRQLLIGVIVVSSLNLLGVFELVLNIFR